MADTIPPSAPVEPPPPATADAAPAPGGRVISGFWRRFGAFCIDSVILGMVGSILGAALFDRLAQLGPSGRWIGFAIAGAYFGIGNSAVGGGRTPGKRLCQVEVVDRNGGHIGLGRALLRYVVFATPFFLNGLPATSPGAISMLLLSLAGPILGLAIIYLAVFNRRTRQSVHDLVAGTYVVRASTSGAVAALPVWRGHFAVIGGCAAALLAGSAIVANRTAGLLASLAGARSAMLATGKVHDAGVFMGKTTTWQNGTTAQTRFITITALVKQRPADVNAIATDMAGILLKTDAAAADEDVIQVSVVYGYDIGIARGSITKLVRHTPAEWATLAAARAAAAI